MFQVSDFVSRMYILWSKLEVCLPLAYPSTIFKHFPSLKQLRLRAFGCLSCTSSLMQEFRKKISEEEVDSIMALSATDKKFMICSSLSRRFSQQQIALFKKIPTSFFQACSSLSSVEVAASRCCDDAQLKKQKMTKSRIRWSRLLKSLSVFRPPWAASSHRRPPK